jgi:hypothetical protein
MLVLDESGGHLTLDARSVIAAMNTYLVAVPGGMIS